MPSPQILSKMTTTPHCSTDIVHIQRDEADSGLLRPPPSCWRHFSWGQIFLLFPWYLMPDMKFVQNFTSPDFQAKNFTPSISPNLNSFSKKKHKIWVKMEKFTPLAKILHCRRHWKHGQIPPLFRICTKDPPPACCCFLPIDPSLRPLIRGKSAVGGWL